MAKERRDSKNRLLWKGEYQKDDGRYMYRYVDANGTARFVYSWTLTKTDRAPKGKTPGLCLRDLEKQIAEDMHDNLDTFTARKKTVNDYFDIFIESKKKIKPTTRASYKRKYDQYLRDRIGGRQLSSVKYSDVCNCYNTILAEDEISAKTLKVVNAILCPIFHIAHKDNLIRSNPVVGALTEVLKAHDFKENKRFALSPDEEKAFFDFIGSSKTYSKWKNLYAVMLGTGFRIGEICGLTWEDCDFKNNIIHVRRTLLYFQDDISGKYRWSIQTPKTECSQRSIPMLGEVRKALLDEKKNRMIYGFCTSEIDGVSGFVFCNRDLGVVCPNEANKRLTRIVNAYNKREQIAAASDGRDALLLPHFSPHILRHTFCTRMREADVDVKVIQNVMGHSKVETTLNIYDELSMTRKQESFRNVDGLFKIG